MKKKFLFLMTLLAVSLFALAEMTVYVYKKDGTKVPYVASTVDSIGFVNVHTITFNANGGTGSMDVVRVKEGESIALPANGFTYAKAEFAGWNTAANGSGTAYADKGTVKPTANMTLYAQWAIATTGTENGYEWVDLGLPSGLKWATCNVGANAPEELGNKYAWGEVTTKYRYDESVYKWYEEGKGTYIKYQVGDEFYVGNDKVPDNKTILDLEDDAAFVNMGGQWRMPTVSECNELQNNCDVTETTINNVSGYLYTSKINGKSIFFPRTGVSASSRVWTSSLNLTERKRCKEAYGYSFSIYAGSNTGERYYGDYIRAVLQDDCSITFKSNGGTGSMSKISFKLGDEIVLPTNSFTRTDYTFVGWNTAADGSGRIYNDLETVKPSSNLTLYAQWKLIIDGHEYVDLGLSVYWATCNVGANYPYVKGVYYQWGETIDLGCMFEMGRYYDSENNEYYKYCKSDGKTILEPEDDAATYEWGGNWRMPTYAEAQELLSKCTWKETTLKGVYGFLVTSKINGNTIFLPYTGLYTCSGIISGSSS